MRKAVEEIQRCGDYDFLIINDDLNEAVGEIEAIITAQRAHKKRRFPLVQRIFNFET